MDNRGNGGGRNRDQSDRVGSHPASFTTVMALARAAPVAMRDTICAALRTMLWLALGGFIMVGMQYSYDLYTDADPVRDVHLTTSVVAWGDGRLALDLRYDPVHSRRCPSLTTHFIQRNQEGTEGRIPVMTYSSGVAPVDGNGVVLPEPFHLVIPLPLGLPPGEYWHQSSRTTACDIIPGLQRHPTPTWTSATPFRVP
jgi:hypothetical protein